MPRVRVSHATEYRYHRAVSLTPHRLMLRPRDSHDLRLIDATLFVTPPPVTTRWSHDVFSNSVCTLDWQGTRTDLLRIVSELDIQHYPAGAAQPGQTIDPAAETYPFSYQAEEYPDLSRLLERQYRDPDRKLDHWAYSFLRRDGPTATMDLLTAITEAIRADFRYAARDAEGTNSPLQTLQQRSGACRDFTMLMIEAVRALGFAARFVSGYLYDEALAERAAPGIGGGSTHAWVSVYLPGAGWVEFDPTNGLVAGRNLVRVCVARTPEQAVPVSGGFIGGRDDFDDLDVNVEVTVGDQVLVTELASS